MVNNDLTAWSAFNIATSSRFASAALAACGFPLFLPLAIAQIPPPYE